MYADTGVRMTGMQIGNRLGEIFTPARMVGLISLSAPHITGTEAGVSFTRKPGNETNDVILRTGARTHGRVLALFFFFISILPGHASSLPVNVSSAPKTRLQQNLKDSVNFAQKRFDAKNHPSFASKYDTPPTADELAAARGVEALMADLLIAEMRKTVPESELFPASQGEKIFRQMLDNEHAKMLSDTGTLGIADAVLAEMKRKR